MMGVAIFTAMFALADADACIDFINGFRSQTGAKGLSGTGGGSCQLEQAKLDCANGAHSSFVKCNEFGQCEASGQSSCEDAVQAFQNEGPGGGHYEIIHNKDYCSVFWNVDTDCNGHNFYTFDFYFCSQSNTTVTEVVV